MLDLVAGAVGAVVHDAAQVKVDLSEAARFRCGDVEGVGAVVFHAGGVEAGEHVPAGCCEVRALSEVGGKRDGAHRRGIGGLDPDAEPAVGGRFETVTHRRVPGGSVKGEAAGIGSPRLDRHSATFQRLPLVLCADVPGREGTAGGANENS